MKPFTIGEVKELFAKDLNLFHQETASILHRLLNEQEGTEILEVAIRHAHTLKGLATTLGATALGTWAINLETLLRLAHDTLKFSEEDGLSILRFLSDRMHLWTELNHLSLEQQHAEAQVLLAKLNHGMESLLRWAPPIAPHPAVVPPPLLSEVLPTNDFSKPPLHRTGPPGLALDEPEADLIQSFLLDAQEHIDILEQEILHLRPDTPWNDPLETCLRSVHTLKGAAFSMDFKSLGEDLHEIETLIEHCLVDFSSKSAEQQKSLIHFLLSCIDELKSFFAGTSRPTQETWSPRWKEIFRQLIPQAKAAAPISELRPAPYTPPVSDSHLMSFSTVRVESSRLQRLAQLMGEILIDRHQIQRGIQDLTVHTQDLHTIEFRMKDLAHTLRAQLDLVLKHDQFLRALQEDIPAEEDPLKTVTPSHPSGMTIEPSAFESLVSLSQNLSELSKDIEELCRGLKHSGRNLVTLNDNLAHTSRKIQTETTGLGMIPMTVLFKRLHRTFRDALDAEGKEADLRVQGESILLDRNAVDRIYPPLLHLLRNAVAHGIEPREVRISRGKSPRGLVQVIASSVSNQVCIEIRDDGSGISPAKIAERALELGLPCPSTPESPSELLDLICHSGFSTSKELTPLSGRGIGCGIVRNEIQQLGGSLQLDYEEGKGTTWTLRLPLIFNVVDGLLVSSGGHRFAIPVDFAGMGVCVQPELIQHAEERPEIDTGPNPVGEAPESPTDSAHPRRLDSLGRSREYYVVGSETLPVLRLDRLLGLPPPSGAPQGLIILAGKQRGLLLLDPHFIHREIALKQLDPFLSKHPFFSGATIDEEGRVLLVLNIPTLFKHGLGHSLPHHPSRPSPHPQPRSPRILVVDDSLSIRNLQKRILLQNGYDVATASDGRDALEKIALGSVDLLITDLQMPRLDGLQLIREIRALERYRQLPILVMSSRLTVPIKEELRRLDVHETIAKPSSEDELLPWVTRLVGPPPSPTLSRALTISWG